jgi:hypothetical protein
MLIKFCNSVLKYTPSIVRMEAARIKKEANASLVMA